LPVALPAVNSPGEALRSGAPFIHERLDEYKHAVKGVFPETNTNIADRNKIRKYFEWKWRYPVIAVKKKTILKSGLVIKSL
jgi:hypothetical protein